MPRFAVLLLSAGLLPASGCSEGDSDPCTGVVESRADDTTDFAAIQTFAVLPSSGYPAELPPDFPPTSDASLMRVNDFARTELIGLGLTEVDPAMEEPNVWVFSVGATEVGVGEDWVCVPGYTWWGLWGYVWDPCAWLEPVQFEYTVGTVVVGLADAVAEKAVFGGAMQGVLECGDTVNRVQAGVETIFADYPMP